MVHRLTEPFQKYSLSKINKYYSLLPDICTHDSEMEREADQAEKEVLDLKMAEYMQREYENDTTKIYKRPNNRNDTL